jgi:hypothetical protein
MCRVRDLPPLCLFLALGLLPVAGCETQPVNSRAIGTAIPGRRPDGGTRPPVSLDAASTSSGDNPDGPPPAARTPGSACERGTDCDSGACSDGVCCNVACGGSCVGCNLPGHAGECIPVPTGQKDPRGVCRAEAPDSCGQSGLCNGQGGCAKFPPGTPCGGAACTGPRTFLPGSECDGDGMCVKGMAIDCTPFNCESAACRSSCVTDADCVPPNVCQTGKCGRRGEGQACTANDQCLSGFCVDGVCCENACTGRCQFCGSPAARGKCTSVRAGAPDPRASAGVTDPARVCLDQGAASCGTNGRCDGKNGCQRYPDGTSCRAPRCEERANSEFGESFCMGGSCRSPAGTSCAPFNGCDGARCLDACDDDDDECVDGLFCIDGRCEKQVQGGECDVASDCANGICAQGRCCDQACDGTCRSCNLTGTRGVCTARTFTSEVTATDRNLRMGMPPTFFEDGDPIPAGHYTVSYVRGCMRYGPMQGWTVNATDGTGCCSWSLIGDTPMDRRGTLPGNIGFVIGMGGHADFDACQAASRMAAPLIIDHPGGKLGVSLQDSDFADNEPGEDDNPTWRLSGTLTCP